MKIAMMTRWNTACGVSVHAELIGRAWVEAGDELTVLAPVENSSAIRTDKDEPWVIRCYCLNPCLFAPPSGIDPAYFDPRPFLDVDYDLFVAQNVEILPMESLLDIFPQIRKKARTLMIVHEGKLPPDKIFYKFEWGGVVCFDERYRLFLKTVFPEDKIAVIPYPCHPARLGNKSESRKALDLPQDRKIILSYGIGVYRHLHLLPKFERLNDRYPLIFLVMTEHPDWYEIWNALQHRYSFIRLIRRALTDKNLYTYLHASDALLIHKDSAEAVVVCSTAYMCMGSGCLTCVWGPVVLL